MFLIVCLYVDVLNFAEIIVKKASLNEKFDFQMNLGGQQSRMWGHLPFWEDVFYDAVAQERESVGLDSDPQSMMDRYAGLSEVDRKRLEMDEDRLLATLLHNLTSFMLMTGLPKEKIQQKVRRLLGKSHVGLLYSQGINKLLDSLPKSVSLRKFCLSLQIACYRFVVLMNF